VCSSDLDWERVAAGLDAAERARALRREAFALGG
jgi:hypothetical protein